MRLSSRRLTLIEVLVAVVLCGAGLAIVAGGVAASVRAESFADDLSRAADHAELVMTRLESQELALENQSSDFTDDGQPDLAYEVEVNNPQDVQTEGLSEITVRVSWVRYNQERTFELVRWVFVDPQAGGVR
ncbi:MAG TPA: hypothetical protein DEA08_35900 [Planctomycetes bacterium]|nr:hypothetical protein [Planctomycetota bacterium]